MIAGAVHESDQELDARVKAWARWRDRDAAEHYWLAADFGAAGRAPSIVVEMSRQFDQQGRSSDVSDIFQHRARPSAVFTPPLLLKAAASLMRRPGTDRRAVMREVRELIATDNHRRRLNRKPEFVPIAEHRDAGETEVPEEVAA